MDADDFGDDKKPHEHLRDGVHKACNAVLEDDELSASEKTSKIGKLLAAHEKLKGDLGKKDDADDDEADDDSFDDTDTTPGDLKRANAAKGGKTDPATEAIALMLRLGKGRKRLTEHRPPARPMDVKGFARYLRRPF